MYQKHKIILRACAVSDNYHGKTALGNFVITTASVVSVSKYFSVTVTVKVNNLFSSYSYS